MSVELCMRLMELSSGSIVLESKLLKGRHFDVNHIFAAVTFAIMHLARLLLSLRSSVSRS